MRKILSSVSPFKILLLASIVTICLSCDDIIEADLADEVFIMMTPPPNFESNTSTINFFWEEVDGAESYRLQVAKPDFVEPIQIFIDSTYRSNSASVNLSAGIYEWRMRAENVNSFTTYVYGNLVVDSTSSLENITPVLISPANNIYTNKDSILFVWEELGNASEYRLETVDITSGLTNQTLLTSNTQVYSGSFNEATYEWKLQALNDFSISSTSSRTFSIDRTAPPAVTLLQPDDELEIEQSEITYKWQIPTDVGPVQSPRFYEFQISNNQEFNGFLFNTPVELTTDSATVQFDLSGTFYWRIQSLDEAGNDSIFSSSRSFTISE